MTDRGLNAGGERGEAFGILSGGMLGMMVAMAIGRFVFAPILPMMQRDLGVTHATAGGLASLNYIGYLAGALACSVRPGLLRSGAVNLGALSASIATTFLMAATTSTAAWGTLRFVSGAASAVLFVAISIEVAERMAQAGAERWSGALYGGIGLGIALTGTLVPRLDALGGWRGAWVGMGALAIVLALLGVALAHKRTPSMRIETRDAGGAGDLGSIRILAAAYFLEGLGYIVSITFIVVMVARIPGLASFAPSSWVVVGLAAAPSTLLWQWAGRCIGVKAALFLAYVIQCVGILVGVKAATVPLVILSAACFGGTMLGIVTLAMAEGSRRAGRDARRAAGILTTCFGAGQVLGPSIAGRIADAQGSFEIPLLLAAASVAVGAMLVLLDGDYRRRAS
ncbi:MAG TPA: YbfB/YjiJ family MFS transporter [Candidatus Deferrimicrobiaceae bacterium]|jgi:predicted MFS family arabinose efflux permease